MEKAKSIFNWVVQTTYWWMSKGLMLESHEGDMGKGDCIGRTRDLYIAQYLNEDVPEDWPDIVQGVMDLWHKNSAGKYYGERYPGYDMVARPMSRDHLANTIGLLKYAEDPRLVDFVENTPFKIDRDRHTIDLWFWKHAVIGKKFHHIMFYVIEIPWMAFTTVKEKVIRGLYGVKKERTQISWDKDYPQSISKKRQKRLNKLLFPTYALVNLGWQISCLPHTRAKRVLQWICRPQIGHTNYWLHMLYKRPVDIANIIRYQPMTGDRPTTSLDARGDRHCVIIKNNVWLQFNQLDKDLGIAMWNYMDF